MSSTDTGVSNGTQEFLVSLVVNLALGLLSLVAVSLLRRRLGYYFDARRLDFIRNPSFIKSNRYLERPPQQVSSFFGWIWQVATVPENVLLRSVGVDSTVTLRFLLRMAVFLTFYAILAFIIIIPVHYTASQASGVTGFNALSMLSLDNGSNRLYCSLVFLYLSTALLCCFLQQQWNDVVTLKQRFFSTEQLVGRKMTLMVSNLPKTFNTNKKLYDYFNNLYPGQVGGTYLVNDTPRLSELYAERQEAVDQINTAKGQMELDSTASFKTDKMTEYRDSFDHEVSITRHITEAKRPTFKTFLIGGEVVDTIDFYTKRLQECDAEIAQLFEKINAYNYQPQRFNEIQRQEEELPNTQNNNNLKRLLKKNQSRQVKNQNVGFVTFTSSIALANALQLPLSNSFTRFHTELAPEPSDISWFGVTCSPLYKYVVSGLNHVLHFLLVVFWSIPVSAISVLLELDNLSKRIPFLKPVLDFNPIVKGFLSGFLPGLALVIFMALLPNILHLMGFLQGIESTSARCLYVFKKYYVFQIVNFYLVACVTSSVFSEIDNIINNPAKIPSMLASGVPQSALLFVNYIQIRALFTNFFSIIDPVTIILNYFFYSLSKTPTQSLNALKPDAYHYEKMLPESMLILMISFTFGTIQPIVLVFGAMYFFTAFFSLKYTSLYINVTEYESGGTYYPLIFNRVMAGLLIGQATLLGLYGTKEHAVVASLTVPLILITVWWWYFMHNKYNRNVISDSNGTEYIRFTSVMARRVDRARTLLSSDQKQAILEGYTLPTSQPYISLLPVLMSDLFGDTPNRDFNLKKHNLYQESQCFNQNAIDEIVYGAKLKDVVDLSENIPPDCLSTEVAKYDRYRKLYKSLLPTKVSLSSEYESDQTKKFLRDFLYLGEQYHGDDITNLPLYYKKALFLYDLLTNNVIDFVLKPFFPFRRTDALALTNIDKKSRDIHDNNNNNNNNTQQLLVPKTANKAELLHQLLTEPDDGVHDYNDKSSHSPEADEILFSEASPSSSSPLLNGSKEESMSLVELLSFEQRIMLAKHVLRWKRYRELSQQLCLNESLNEDNSNELPKIVGDEQHHEGLDDIVANPQMESLPSFCTTHTLPFPSHLLQKSSSTVSPINRNELQKTSPPSPPFELTTFGDKASNMANVENDVITQHQTMLRYHQPQLNPSCYSEVYDRLWGRTYLAYRAQQKMKK